MMPRSQPSSGLVSIIRDTPHMAVLARRHPSNHTSVVRLRPTGPVRVPQAIPALTPCQSFLSRDDLRSFQPGNAAGPVSVDDDARTSGPALLIRGRPQISAR